MSGAVTLITQSDIDSIDSCTTIYGDLIIVLQANSSGLGIGGSPTTFTLPSNLQAIDGQCWIITSPEEYPTTSFLAPNLKTIGGNVTEDDNPEAKELLISGGSYTTTFPALTAIAGTFGYTSYTQTVFTGFPVLETVGGIILINGTFSSLQLPDLTSAGDILISSTNPSFECPSNIVPYFNCNITYCTYSPAGKIPAPYNCNLDEPSESTVNGSPVATSITSATAPKTTTATKATTGTTTATGATKASGALALKCSGNQHLKRS